MQISFIRTGKKERDNKFNIFSHTTARCYIIQIQLVFISKFENRFMYSVIGAIQVANM